MWPYDPDDFESSLERPDSLEDGQLFVVCDDDLLTTARDGVWQPLTFDEYRWLDLEIHSEQYLGRFRGRPCLTIAATLRSSVPPGYAAVPLRALLGRVEAPLFYLAGRAIQILRWHVDHSFCGRCGTKTEDHESDRAKECPECGLVCYPRLSPSIIVLVRRGEEALLARNARWRHGTYSTLAGFLEPGESVEQGLHREVYEEVGLSVENLRYLGSQSWPFPNSLMLGYHADYQRGDIVCHDGEIAEARWFHHSRLPDIPPRTSISRWLIDAFVEEFTGRPAGELPGWQR